MVKGKTIKASDKSLSKKEWELRRLHYSISCCMNYEGCALESRQRWIGTLRNRIRV